MGIFKNADQFMRGLEQAQVKQQERWTLRLKNIIADTHHEVTARTPVWSGQALANYQWSVGTPAAGMVGFIDNGPPGPTNTMPLGTEPRRRPNQDIADQSLQSLPFSDPYVAFYMTNNAPDALELEAGLLPSQMRSRSPNGMVGLTMAYVFAKLEVGAYDVS